jgi:hypothetical protein
LIVIHEREKREIADGSPTPVAKKHAEWEAGFAGAGTFAARAEERLKQRLVQLWETRKTKG